MCSGPDEEVEGRGLRVIIAGGLTGQDAGLHQGRQSPHALHHRSALHCAHIFAEKLHRRGASERVWGGGESAVASKYVEIGRAHV